MEATKKLQLTWSPPGSSNPETRRASSLVRYFSVGRAGVGGSWEPRMCAEAEGLRRPAGLRACVRVNAEGREERGRGERERGG